LRALIPNYGIFKTFEGQWNGVAEFGGAHFTVVHHIQQHKQRTYNVTTIVAAEKE
jgi:hypothetical protein